MTATADDVIIDLRDTDARARVSPATLRVSICWALALVAVLNALDIFTTRVALAGGAVEANPVARALLGSGRVELLKAAVILVLGLRLGRRRPSLALHAMLWATAGVYLLTVANNIYVMARVG